MLKFLKNCVSNLPFISSKEEIPEKQHNSNSSHYNVPALQNFASDHNDKETPAFNKSLGSYRTQGNLLLPEPGSAEK